MEHAISNFVTSLVFSVDVVEHAWLEIAWTLPLLSGGVYSRGAGHVTLRELLSRVWRVARLRHPGSSLRVAKRRGVFMWRCLKHRAALRAWFDRRANPVMRDALDSRPQLLDVVERPFVHARWSVEQKMSVIEEHYRILSSAPAFLQFSPDSDRQLWQQVLGGHTLRLVLDRPAWFIGEGEIALNLFDGDERLYTVAFSMGTVDAEMMAYVGALQGREGRAEAYRTLTHAMHGMRPRDFLFTSFRLLCTQLGVRYVLAVADSTRQHRSQYFDAKHGIHNNYDEFWREYHGVDLGNGFYRVEAPVVLRRHEEIPTRKRAQYRRRYEMLAGVATQLASACERAPVG